MLKLTTIILTALWIQTGNWNVDKNGIALDGYDVISYFEGKPKVGSPSFSTMYDHATFYFTTKEHLAAFEKNPSKYLPEYGGFCAFAMADYAGKVSVNPETYTITDGRLYLFYNSKGANTLVPWQKNESEMIQKADNNWKTKYLNP